MAARRQRKVSLINKGFDEVGGRGQVGYSTPINKSLPGKDNVSIKEATKRKVHRPRRGGAKHNTAAKGDTTVTDCLSELIEGIEDMQVKGEHMADDGN